MNLMSNEHITWTVERERGISFDLTAFCDMEVKPDAFLDAKREIKPELDPDSGVKDTTFGHPFGQCRPTPQPRPPSPSPFSRPVPTKRLLPPSFESRDNFSKLQWGGKTTPAQAATALGRTRSQGVRPTPPKSALGANTSSNSSGTSSSKPKPVSAKVKAERGEARAPRRRTGGVDTMALTAELGLVDSRRRCIRRNKGSIHRVGAYTLEERSALVAKFHAKRGRRIWRKKIKYDCRKKLADKRPRLKGRFVTQEELDGLDKETLAKVTGLGPYEPDSSSSDAEGDSDSSEGYTGPAPTTSRYRGGGRCGGGGRREVQQRPRSSARTPSAARAAGAKGRRAGAASVACAKTPQGNPSPTCGNDKGVAAIAVAGASCASSSSEPSSIFDVKVEVDMEVDVDVAQEKEEDTVIKVEGYEPSDLVPGFMVDDILSNNFAIVPTRDMEAISAGVVVN